MGPLVIDSTLPEKLLGLTEPAELCDQDGRIVGRFVPKIDWSQWEPMTPEVSEEELDDRERSNDWVSSEEVLAHLRRLEEKQS